MWKCEPFKHNGIEYDVCCDPIGDKFIAIACVGDGDDKRCVYVANPPIVGDPANPERPEDERIGGALLLDSCEEAIEVAKQHVVSMFPGGIRGE
tara:strand:- start:1847 stop:2128 length:282 start_codon:yes stop_codon:yes gene_type:complete